MRFQLTQPRGVSPRALDCPQSPEYAQRAVNIDLTNNGWTPWLQPMELAKFGKEVLSAHVRDCCWDGVPLAEARFTEAGTCGKTYISGPGECPMVSDDFCAGDWRRLGVPRPDAPSATVVASDDVCGPLGSRVSYKLVYVNKHCEEGAGSGPSNSVDVSEKGVVAIGLPPPPDPCWEVTEVRIYRLIPTLDIANGFFDLEEGGLNAGAATIDTQAEYFHVGTVPIEVESFIDDCSTMGQALINDDAYAPVKGLQIRGETDQNSLVGYEGKNVWFSERNMYWAWPRRSRHNFPSEVCGVAVCGDSVLVVTEDSAYVIGDTIDCVDSACRPIEKDKTARRCCGTGDLVQVGASVLYTTLDGLVRLTTDAVSTVVSSRAFDKRGWLQLAPNCIRLGMGCGHLFLSTPDEEIVWPLAFDEQGQLPDHVSTLSFCVDQWISSESDELFFLKDNRIYKFNAGPDYMDMEWQQADQRVGGRTTVSAFRAEYREKKLTRGNLVSLYREQKPCGHSMKANKPVRVRGTLADCYSIRVIGKYRMCGLFYGPGISNLTT